MRAISRRRLLASTSALVLAPPVRALAQAAPETRAAASGDTDWLHYANDLASTRYAPLDQINAANFDKLEVAWRFSTNAFGPQLDAYFNCTPLIAKGRLYSTVGTARYVVALDGATGQLLWAYRHDEKGRQGTRSGSGFGLAYWTDGQVERILYVTRSYQMVCIDARTGLPDPAFGVNGEVDLRLDWDQAVDPKRGVVGLHSPPLVVRNTVVVGTAPTEEVKAYVRAFDVRTGKRKWIFHTIPMKGEFGYDTWTKPGQAETSGNTAVWAPMSADEALGHVYLPVESPQTDYLGVTRLGANLFATALVAVDIETGERRWHYQTVHHQIWDYDLPCAPIVCDIVVGGKTVKAIAQPSKQSYLYVLDRTTGKPVWPIPERPVAKGDIPGEDYAPTQPIPSKPPAFDRQGFTVDDLVDFTPEIKARALAVASHYRLGPLFTPPSLFKADGGPWGTLTAPASQGGANWPGGSLDPETSIFYIFSKTSVEAFGITQAADGTLGQRNGAAPPIADPGGGAFGGTASLKGGAAGRGAPNAASVKDGLNDPILPGVLSVGGIPLNKPPYGRITAIDLKTGTLLWQVAHGETPDHIRNNPLLKGVTIPRTGQGGILGALTTKTLVICGDSGLFTDETGRKGARLRAYDKATGRELGAVFQDKAQTGAPMTYMLGGRQYIVNAVGGNRGADLVAYRLPERA